jgi:hypothetical protein
MKTEKTQQGAGAGLKTDTTKNLMDAMGILTKAYSSCYLDQSVPHQLVAMLGSAKAYIGTQITVEVRGA